MTSQNTTTDVSKYYSCDNINETRDSEFYTPTSFPSSDNIQNGVDPKNHIKNNTLKTKKRSQKTVEFVSNSDEQFSKTLSSSNSDSAPDIIETKRTLRRKIILILVIVNITSFIASFSYWIQSGLLPYLTRKLGVTPEIFGYMQSTFAFYQLIGSPIFGRAGDVFGCRVIMVVSELASAVTYGALAFSTTIWMLFLARVPAFFMHNLQGSYMIITDVTLPSERADLIGKLGVSHGLGMIAGSFVGGLVTSSIGERAAASVAGLGNLVSVVIIIIFIPDDTKDIRRKLDELYISEKSDSTDFPSVSSVIGLKEIINVLKLKIVKYLLLIKILSGFPFSLLYSMFTMAIMDHFKLGPKENGFILAYIGFLGIFTQGILIGLLTKFYPFPTLIKYAVILNSFTYMMMIVAEHILILCFLLLPLAIGGTVLHIVITTAITKVVPIEDTGSALGISSAISALVRSVAPTLGGLIFVNLGWPFFGVIGYVMGIFVAIFIFFYPNDNY